MFESTTTETFNVLDELDTRKYALSAALQMDIPENRDKLLEDAEKIYQWLTKEDGEDK